MREKNALFLVGGRLDSYKAYTQNFLSFISLARERGYKITISGLRKTDESFVKEIADKTIIFTKSPLGILRLIIANVNELVSRHYALIVMGSLYTWTFVIYYLVLKIRKTPRVVYYMQDPVPETKRLMGRKGIFIIISWIIYSLAILCEKLACNISNIILLPGRGYFRVIERRNKLRGKKIMFAYNTWGVYRFASERDLNNNKILVKQIKEKYEISSRSPIILYSGKLQRRIRGIEMQLRAIRKLVKHNPKVSFFLTGSGDIDYFMTETKRLNLINNVVFTGVLTDKELKVLYSLSDIMIFPPVNYLLPSKFFESLYMGLIPIVWKKSSDMVKVLGKNAITYNGTKMGLIKALKHVINNLPYYKRRISRATTNVLKFHGESVKAFNMVLMEEY